MNFFFFFFLLFICKPLLSAENRCKDGSRGFVEVIGASERIMCGKISRDDPKFGVIILPNSKIQVIVSEKGKLLYDKVYTSNEHGMRVSSTNKITNKVKHFLLIDGSVAFGAGLNDDETVTHWINTKSKIYEAYAVGYEAYTDQHTWLTFEEGNLPKKVNQKKGRALLISDDIKIDALAATISSLPNSRNRPHIVEEKNGSFKYVGRFIDTTTNLNKFLILFCLPVAACKNLMFTYNRGKNDTNIDADTARLARLYSSIDKFYREQFDVEQFAVGWTGSPDSLARLQKHLTIPSFQMPNVDRYSDYHPKPEGAKKWADYILTTMLKN